MAPCAVAEEIVDQYEVTVTVTVQRRKVTCEDPGMVSPGGKKVMVREYEYERVLDQFEVQGEVEQLVDDCERGLVAAQGECLAEFDAARPMQKQLKARRRDEERRARCFELYGKAKKPKQPKQTPETASGVLGRSIARTTDAAQSQDAALAATRSALSWPEQAV